MFKRLDKFLSENDGDYIIACTCYAVLFIGSIFINHPVAVSDLLLAFTGIWFLIQHYNRPSNRPKEEKKDGNSNQG